MDRVPRFILLGVYGQRLVNVCVVLKGHTPRTCMCSGCQIFSQAQSIIVGEEPQPNEYFESPSAAEKNANSEWDAIITQISIRWDAYYGVKWDTEPDVLYSFLHDSGCMCIPCFMKKMSVSAVHIQETKCSPFED
eukprot:2083054-Karenia_brevis.AAC.1